MGLIFTKQLKADLENSYTSLDIGALPVTARITLPPNWARILLNIKQSYMVFWLIIPLKQESNLNPS
jgi:hypothetical protein